MATQPKPPAAPPHKNGKPVIELVGVYKSYFMESLEVPILKDINITVREGEFVAIMGPSGSGKSTLMNLVGCLDVPTKGKVFLDGHDITKLADHHLARIRGSLIGFVFQKFNLINSLSAWENVALPLIFHGTPAEERKARAIRTLSSVGMADRVNNHPNQLSGGQQQRVAIARALILKPKILLMDEPFSALDAKIRVQMREELKKIQQELGITVMFVTHDQEEAMAISHRIVVMSKGKFEQIGTPADVYDNPTTRFTAEFMGNMNFIKDTERQVLLAVRPENISLDTVGNGSLKGRISTIMVLGHFLEINMDTEQGQVKAFTPREYSAERKVGEEVGIVVGRHLVFPAAG